MPLLVPFSMTFAPAIGSPSVFRITVPLTVCACAVMQSKNANIMENESGGVIFILKSFESEY